MGICKDMTERSSWTVGTDFPSGYILYNYSAIVEPGNLHWYNKCVWYW